ncbi:MAG TPA: hypothetical protein VJ966_09095, partial [Actinomycetes bacterium]|nr:hypothetical protein [Actinomycetes bacterium]
LASQGRGQVAVGGASTPHGPVLEFGGTLRRYHSEARTQVRAQPFIYPALADQREQVMDTYEAAVERLTARAFPAGRW